MESSNSFIVAGRISFRVSRPVLKIGWIDLCDDQIWCWSFVQIPLIISTSDNVLYCYYYLPQWLSFDESMTEVIKFGCPRKRPRGARISQDSQWYDMICPVWYPPHQARLGTQVPGYWPEITSWECTCKQTHSPNKPLSPSHVLRWSYCIVVLDWLRVQHVGAEHQYLSITLYSV